MSVLPPDPASDPTIKTGPSDTWRPSAHHLMKIRTSSKWMQTCGLPKHKADAWAFEIWKIHQRVDST
jgi:hypothetical protein